MLSHRLRKEPFGPKPPQLPSFPGPGAGARGRAAARDHAASPPGKTSQRRNLSAQYLTSHFQRMWTRFNYFVVIEAALIGGKTIFGDEAISLPGLAFGFGLSLVWYVMGAEDRFLVQVYRDQVKQAGESSATSLWPEGGRPYRYVGNPTDTGQEIRRSLAGWRFEFISTTRLAALIPFVVALGLLIAHLAK